MKLNPSAIGILFGIYFIFLCLIDGYLFLMAGLGIWVVITGLFEIKNYHNNKLYLIITGLILIVSSIISYMQLSSPLYQEKTLFNYFFAIFSILAIILGTYDFTHNNKLIKLGQMKNTSQKTKDIIAIILLITGLIVGLLIGIYFYKI